MSTMQMTAAKNESSRQWMKAALLSALVVAVLMLLSNLSVAADGTEFLDAATKFETWAKGNLGKLAAFVALAVGSVVAAVKKDWTWFFGAVVLSIGVGVIAGVINASFTATI
jgi:conjugal transfer pilus assembly protein TraA